MQEPCLAAGRSAEIEGDDVLATNGDDIADLEDFVLDAEKGNASFAIVSEDGFLRFG